MGTRTSQKKESRASVDAESIFALYDDLAVEIIDDARPNTDAALSYSNRELAENICRTMQWEDFDLFETHNFEAVHAADDEKTCLAYAFLSFLRWRVFHEASKRGVGIEAFNQKAAAYSEYWYITLVERWNALTPDSTPMKAWIN
jgi:hypothetical protein